MAPALTVQQLRDALQALDLDSRGTKDTLRKRLARYSRASSSSSSRPTSPPPPAALDKPAGQSYHSFLVCDVEATCQRIDHQPWGKLAFAYPNEIIEWPVILLQWCRKERHDAANDSSEDQQWQLVKTDEYHSFVRPVWNPKLSEFCTELTGITQDDVDAAPTFPELCKRFYRDFILPHRLFTPANRTIWVTDGPWDLRDFVAKTCYLSKTPRPPWLAGEIIDLRNLASAFFASLKKRAPSPTSLPPPRSSGGGGTLAALAGTEDRAVHDEEEPQTPAPLPAPLAPSPLAAPRSSATEAVPAAAGAAPAPAYLASAELTAPATLSLPSVLAALTLAPFDGRLHSGLCDARNAARILADLSARGVALEANRRVPDGGRGARERRWPWMDDRGGVKWAQWSEREKSRASEDDEDKGNKGKGGAA